MSNSEHLFVIQRLAPITQYQDLGRYGLLHQGISQAGPMDDIAFSINNRLLGNDDNAAQLEIAPGGLQLKCLASCTISISGAYLKPTLNGKPLINFCATHVHSGDILSFGFAQAGQFAYLAVAGGFSPSSVLESRSTTKRLQIFPGGEALTVGSTLVGSAIQLPKLQGEARENLPDYKEKVLEIIPAFHYDNFSSKAKESMINQKLRVMASDRMGTRLEAQQPIVWQNGDLLSEGLLPGAVQIPPDGNPIVLQKDAQSIGGYPKIGRLTKKSLALLAQKQSGDTFSFQWV